MVDSSSDSKVEEAIMTARMYRQAERAVIKERRLLSLRRTLRFGERRRIVELRFNELGSKVVSGLSYLKIARKL